MVILRSQNKITDFLMILAWASRFNPIRDRLYTSESDVCRRQILMYKDGLRTERIAIFMTVDPCHRYSNEAETVN